MIFVVLSFNYHADPVFLFVSCLSHHDLSDDLPLCSHFGLLGRAGGKPFPSAWTRRNENIRYRIFLRRLNTAFLASNWGMRHLRLLGIFLIKVVGGIVVAPKVKDGSSRTQTVSSDALKAGRKYLLTSFPQLKQVAPQLPWTKRKEDWFWDLGRFGDVKGNTTLTDSVAEILKKNAWEMLSIVDIMVDETCTVSCCRYGPTCHNFCQQVFVPDNLSNLFLGPRHIPFFQTMCGDRWFLEMSPVQPPLQWILYLQGSL